MFKDPLQKRLGQMESEHPSPSLRGKKTSVAEKMAFFYRYFDNATLDEKIRIFKEKIEKTDLPRDSKDVINNVFINKILQGKDTPGSISVYWYSKEKDTPSEIISMLQSISNAVAPGLAKQKAFEMYAYALEKLNDAVEHPEHGSALITAILSLHVACCDMAEANPDAGLSRYRVIGDKFFLLAIKLKKAGKLEESQACIRMVLNYYKEGLVRVPDDLHDNWTEYSNGQTKDLRTDWKTTKEDEIELLGGMASLAMLK